MKIKSIIWSTLAVMGMLTACTSEEIIDTPVHKVGSVTIQFTTANTMTKADAAEDPNQWATAVETTINNYVIAVFEGKALNNNSKCVKLVNGVVSPSTTTESETGNTDGQTVKAYSTTVTDLPVDTELSFLVIANAQTAQIPTTWSDNLTYASFAKVETTSSFAASNLLKVGKKEGETLSASATASVVKVPLTQLTARIDFAGVEYTDKAGETTVTKKGDWTDVTGESLKELFNTYFKDNTNQRQELNQLLSKAGVTNKGGEYVYNSQNKKYLFFNYDRYYKGRLSIQKITNTVTKTSSSNFTLTGKTVGNINHKSDILIYDTLSVENDENGLESDPVAFDKSFYTYELAQASGNMLLGIKGGLASSKTVTETTEYQIKVYDRERNSDNSWTLKGTFNMESLKRETSKTEDMSPSTTTEYILSIPYTKIIKGNLYKVTGKFNPSVQPTIEWEVVDMDGVTVNIPSFS